MQIRCLTKSQVSPVTLTGPGLYCFIRGKGICLFGWRKNLPGECRQAEGLAKPLLYIKFSGLEVSDKPFLLSLVVDDFSGFRVE